MIRKQLKAPNELLMDRLRRFFEARELLSEETRAWIREIQFLRNSVHAFNGRDLRSHGELVEAIGKYKQFLTELDGHLPYP